MSNALKLRIPHSDPDHGCQMAVPKSLECRHLALLDRGTIGLLNYAAYVDPFLSLDCDGLGVGGARKERGNILTSGNAA